MSDKQPIGCVGLIGAGAMGSSIAKHIVAAGWPVVAWDRDSDALASIAQMGVMPAGSIADMADCTIVISIVFDDAATHDITFGAGRLLETLGPDAIHVVMASITPALSRELQTAHAASGQHYLAASMFGRPEAAEAAQLLVNCSGSSKAYARVEPLLRLLGTVRWIGEEPEKAMLVKAIGNSMITAAGEMVREMFGFLDAGGIDKPLAKELLIDTLFAGPIFDGSARRHIADPAVPRMTSIARKDRDTCLAAARGLGVDLPLIGFLAAQDLP
jgi:3-hydroxyisobutyrate dehydrogenase-like beta-hydroxyacid dehydrogenase